MSDQVRPSGYTVSNTATYHRDTTDEDRIASLERRVRSLSIAVIVLGIGLLIQAFR